MNSSVSFIHISDTHLGGTKDFKLNGVNVYSAAEKAVQAIKDLQLKYDFIIHTGDVASVDGTRDEYQLASELFKSLNAAMYYVTGNHDTSSLMKELLQFGEHTPLSEDPNRLFYRFEINNHLFLVLDAKARKDQDPHGELSEDQLKKLEQILKESDRPITLFIHYPTQRPESLWLNSMNLLNESEVLTIFNRYAAKIQGVFSGHIHKGITMVKNQIVYSTVGSTCMQFRNNPEDTDVIFTSSNTGFFNHVTISESAIDIKEYSYVNDTGVFVKDRFEMTGIKR
jgi:Icc protein